MPRHAALLLRETVSYRADAFAAGFARHGFEVGRAPKPHPERGDVLLVWNYKPGEGRYHENYRKAGATVLVAENGYIGKGQDGGKLFALAKTNHNGAGQWRCGGPERFAALGLELAPWRKKGSFLLVLPQRGIGGPGVAMPRDWLQRTLTGLKARTDREIRIRRHPGASKEDPYEALAGCHAAVTWGSGAGIKALAAGFPVFSDFAQWIGFDASAWLAGDLEDPCLSDAGRLAMFERLAWAQWSLGEITSGEAVAWLMS